MQKHILIIEDEQSIQNILKAFLEDAGYNVTLADDGMAGIAAFHKATYDLVLLDCFIGYLEYKAITTNGEISEAEQVGITAQRQVLLEKLQ